MAVIKVGNNSIGKISVIEPYDDSIGYQEIQPTPWVRPSHWLDMPVINSGDHKAAFLYAIPSGEDLKNYAKFFVKGIDPIANINTHFTIDWGDSTTYSFSENHSRHVTPDGCYPEHEYDFSDLPESSQFEENGILYRQALIQIDASESGIGSFNYKFIRDLGVRRDFHPVQEFNINLPSGITIGGNIYGYSQRHPMLEKARLYCPTATDISYYFYNSPKLRSIELGPFNNLGRARGLFSNCSSLDYIPDIDLSNAYEVFSLFYGTAIKHYRNELNLDSANSLSSMFQNCKKLKSVHIDIPSSVTNINNMFYGCDNLANVSGDFTTSSLTNASETFRDCQRLVYCPEVNLSGVTSTVRMFYRCTSMKNHPRLYMPNYTNAESMFSSCSELKEVHIEDISNVSATYCRYMFTSCYNLRKITFGNNVIGATYASSMFSNCQALETFPSVSFSGVDMGSMFYGCAYLKEVGDIETPFVTNFSSAFSYCHNLKSSPVTDFTAGGAGNVNASYMFRGCSALSGVPNLDFSRIYSAREMFVNCGNLSLDIGTLDLSNNNRTITTDGNVYYYTFGGSDIRSIDNLIIPQNADLNQTFYNSNLIRFSAQPASGMNNTSTLFNFCYDLASGYIPGIDKSIGYERCLLSSGSATEIIDNLASGVTGQTLNFTNSPGAQLLHSDTIAIATSKGWMVTT
jgi:hypothetical protein